MKMAQEVQQSAGQSIGFDFVKSFTDEDGVRHHTEVAMFEYSITPPGFQAVPGAEVTGLRYAAQLLHNAGFKTEAQALEAQLGTQGATDITEAQALHSLNQTFAEIFTTLRR
jgi:hypothetical protein